MRVCSRRTSSTHQIAQIHQPAGSQPRNPPELGCRRERCPSQSSRGASGPSEHRCSAERSAREPVAAEEVTSSRPTHLGILSPAAHPPDPKTEEPTDPAMSSDPSAPPAVPPLHSPKSPVWPTFPFQREGSRIWERGNLLLRDLPSPLPTKRTRTYSATARASAGPIFKGVCKQFSRSQGHGFITPENGTEDIFVHVSDIEGEYVPVEGDEVTYKVCPIPPKNQKFQAVEVVLTNLAPHTKHETWSGQIIGS
ncbi:cold shock domain-containing protein C2 isoform X1 [Oenanthe melanoleuca]|nr:cold shock domain-containing protein C2 isoform X1 [Oenanthe melanoleuca]